MAVLVCSLMVLTLGACASGQPFEIKDISMKEASQMMDDKETFVLLFERDNCPFCAALNDYIEKTKSEHPNLVVYKVDVTDFELYREQEGDMTLISENEQGKELLKRFPYYLYTPALYLIKDGKPVQAALGFDENNGTVSLWDVNSTIQWDQAAQEDVWKVIENGQAPKEGESKETTDDKKTETDVKANPDGGAKAENADDSKKEEQPADQQPADENADNADSEDAQVTDETIVDENVEVPAEEDYSDQDLVDEEQVYIEEPTDDQE